MSCLVELPWSQARTACREVLRGNSRQLKYLLTKLASVLAFKRGSRTSASMPEGPFDLPDFRRNNLPENPVVAVVIPAYIRGQQSFDLLMRLLNSINGQSDRADYVIVIDDGSPYSYELDTRLCRFICLEKNSGPATARNRGLLEAESLGADIIAFIDTDCIAHEDWIKEIKKGFVNDPHACLVSGRTLSFDKNWFGEFHDLEGTLNGRRFKDSEFLLYGTTSNLAITADVGRSTRFGEQFPDAASEDLQFCFKALDQGFGIRHIETMVVHHDYGYNGSTFSNLRRFWRQFEKYGRGERVLLADLPDYYGYHDQTVTICNDGCEVKDHHLVE